MISNSRRKQPAKENFPMINYQEGGNRENMIIFFLLLSPTTVELKQADIGLHRSMPDRLRDCPSTLLSLTLIYYPTLIKHLEASCIGAA